ncbi:hypothetical protein PUNSTDRAFT_56735 [Punctularia strigosozonata HHB-11173 SS5]|uniref:uncharacterized protein n=1 Tax=Punctularia strigosozonata (strain HHB-11173) TaxID=741275 RepID=UPI000441855C|nr:uncharacterized protein PUNSTDRAFT_56735 [Punctularia strigosozonata HHB-11173 SS5]EIN13893.1 hypothetical protein PUNSTDRAFT_56735 [Punctularia strigosozonata HHB-11173 SS5]
MSGPPDFLQSVLAARDEVAGRRSRPWVTLTFAQSLDAKIAGVGGKQLILSGKQSMVMTHWCFIAPRRLPPTLEGVRRHLPRPIVLDAHLRLLPSCKLLQNYQTGHGRRPWVVCLPGASGAVQARRLDLEAAGARIVEVTGERDMLSLSSLLETLLALGIKSLMVEGGAQVIGSFMAEAQDCVDCIIVTTAPVFVGRDGVGYGTQVLGSQMANTQHVRSEIMGEDTVLALRVGRALTS